MKHGIFAIPSTAVLLSFALGPQGIDAKDRLVEAAKRRLLANGSAIGENAAKPLTLED